MRRHDTSASENSFCVHEPQYAAQDPSFGYNIYCAKFYLRHTDTYFLHLRAQSWANSELSRVHGGPATHV